MPGIAAIVDCPLDCPQEEENKISTCHTVLQLLTVAMQATLYTTVVDYFPQIL